jgi:poly(3-hydroxybutyrate) depolymerase
MEVKMPSLPRILFSCSVIASMMWPAMARAIPQKAHPAKPQAKQQAPQDTGFLNRHIDLHGITYRFQVYLPEDWRRDDGKLWPIILFLHGRGERGSEGMWQTQIGIAEAVRNHPDRWPFVIVMPQCPLNAHWTDPAMLELAMAALEQESAEFHGDPARTYLTGLSLGGYGAWELARAHPHRWAAIAIAAGGVFWSYEPDRWQQASTLPAEYARAVGRMPVWLFHGSLDTTVLQSGGRKRPLLALPGSVARLLDARLRRAGPAALVPGAPHSRGSRNACGVPHESSAPAHHQAHRGATRQLCRAVSRAQRARRGQNLPYGRPALREKPRWRSDWP